MKPHCTALAALAVLTGCAQQSHEAQGRIAPAVTTTVAHIGEYTATVKSVGRVGGVNGNQANLSFLVPGVIKNVYVHIGDRVSEGEPLAELDARGYELAAAQARSDVAVAAGNARAAGINRYSTRLTVDRDALNRAATLYQLGVSPRKDVEAARAQLAQDQADSAAARDQSSSDQAALRSAQFHAALADRDAENSVLRAPEDGVVSAILHRAGESVDSTVPVVALSQTQTGEVTLTVASGDLPNVHIGDAVHFTIVGSEEQSDGTVTGVANSVDATTQTGTVMARGLPTGAPIGSVIEAQIAVARLRGLVVPESAIVQDPQTGHSVVFVATTDKDGTPTFRQRIVDVQAHNGTSAIVRFGLQTGERIATQGAFTLLAPSDTGGD